MATTITANGINFPDGSAGSPSIGGTDTNTGLFTGSDIVGFATGGSERLRIDASGNVNIANDSGQLRLGTDADLLVYHNGSDSYVKNSTGDLYIRDTNGNVFIQPKTDENGIKCIADGAVELYHNNVKRFETDTDGVRVVAPEGAQAMLRLIGDEGDDNNDYFRLNAGGGTLKLQDASNGSSWEDNIVINAAGSVELYHDNTKTFETSSSGVTVTGNVFPSANDSHALGGSSARWQELNISDVIDISDNGKIRMGDSDDYQVYFDGSTVIHTATSSNISIRAKTGENAILMQPDGGVSLYYDDSQRLQTTSAGGTLTGTWSGVGKILQVLQSVKTDTFSTSSSSYTDATGLSVAITPSSSSNKILIILDVKIGAGHEDAAFSGRLMRDSTARFIGDTASNRSRGSFGTSRQSGNAGYDVLQDRQAVFLDSPNTTSSTTYKLQVRCNNSRDVYVNRTHDDSDDNDTPRTASSITVMEVSA